MKSFVGAHICMFVYFLFKFLENYDNTYKLLIDYTSVSRKGVGPGDCFKKKLPLLGVFRLSNLFDF